MSISLVQRLSALFDNIWSFILTLVRSLLALFSFRRRSSDPFALPRVNRTPKEALARAHTRLRPILLTPRAVARSPGHHTQRAHSTRSPSATSTLFLGQDQNASASGSVLHPNAPQRTSPKLGPQDIELGLSSNTPPLSDHTGPSVANATSFGTDASSLTTPVGSLCVLSLTPPDRCYLAPMSSTDCPYAEPTDRASGKPKLPGSPLRVSINVDSAYPEPMLGPIGSPPPRHWSPAQIWTSTPFKADDTVPDPVLDHASHSTMDSATLGIAHALVSRSQNCMVQAYDDTSSHTSPSLDQDPLADSPKGHPAHDPYSMHAHAVRATYEPYPYPRFHAADPYACTWNRHTRLPGKTHYPRSRSHADLRASAWYDADAYVPSPNPALSPPLPADSEDEDEVPLGRLQARLAHRRGVALSAHVGFGVRPAEASPGTRRRRSEGCLLAMLASSPTPIGLGGRAGRQALSQVVDADGYTRDWLEALSLQFSPERVNAVVPAAEA